MKACQAQLLEMQEMEQMVEFLKVDVPQWEGHVLQVSRYFEAPLFLGIVPFAVFVTEKPRRMDVYCPQVSTENPLTCTCTAAAGHPDRRSQCALEPGTGVLSQFGLWSLLVIALSTWHHNLKPSLLQDERGFGYPDWFFRMPTTAMTPPPSPRRWMCWSRRWAARRCWRQ